MRPILGHPLLKLLLASTHNQTNKINFNFKQYKHKNNKNNHYIINYLSVPRSLIIYKIFDTLLDMGVVMQLMPPLSCTSLSIGNKNIK